VDREDLEAVAFRSESEFATDSIADFGEFRDVDRLNFVGVDADEQVARSSTVYELIVGLLGVEEHLLNDAGFLEQFDRSIDRGFGDAVAAPPHLIQ